MDAAEIRLVSAEKSFFHLWHSPSLAFLPSFDLLAKRQLVPTDTIRGASGITGEKEEMYKAEPRTDGEDSQVADQAVPIQSIETKVHTALAALTKCRQGITVSGNIEMEVTAPHLSTPTPSFARRCQLGPSL